MKRTLMSTDRGMDKEDVVHIMEYYSAIKQQWNNAVCSNVNGPRRDLSKWSQSDREKEISYGISSMWGLKHDTNEFICKTEKDSQRK